MNLKDACIARDGLEEGSETFKEIINECQEALDNDDPGQIEEILHENGFEPDYIMDVLDLIG